MFLSDWPITDGECAGSQHVSECCTKQCVTSRSCYIRAAAAAAAAAAVTDVTASTCRIVRCSGQLQSADTISVNTKSVMEHSLTVTIDQQGRGRTSVSSSVLPQTHGSDNDDDDVLHLPLSRSRHSVDCTGLKMSSTSRQSTSASRSTSRLHLGVPSDLRRSSLQTDRHHHHHHHRGPHQPRREDSTCDGDGCAQSSGSRSSVALTDDGVSGRRVSYGGPAPVRSTTTVSTPREATIFDIGADLIKVCTSPPVQ